MILFTGSGSLATTFAKYYNCEVISARHLDDDALSQIFKKTEVIIHNAALIRSEDISKLIESNFLLTKRIVEIANSVNPSIKIINISSMSFLKDDSNYLDPLAMSNYAYSKYIAELFCLKYSMKNIINVRFSTIFYGDYERDGLSKLGHDCVSNNTLTLYNDGEAVRDFIPLEVAVQYLFKLTQFQTKSRTINIVSGRETSFKYFSNKLIDLKPETKIVNIVAQTANVLSKFSKIDIEYFGEIQYNIEDFFDNYILKLNEDINI